ncbi:MAG: 2-hydroxyacyl-CoA dehydratase family protein [Acidobacteriota bacterium]|jgi:benzoyl-CoA reductase/2-hydroxyglutaryl-CoA dehydratase subunit BcrC/BadD/HgdB|nr:2-hydroxyacyl-CoA dehydratase family protein [Acidobacteriota bacterium]
MTQPVEPLAPLIDDEYTGLPLKRSLARLLEKRESGVRGVGVYCTYAPVELIRAAGAVPITLCAYANKTIPEAEKVLPANLCPLIKSSYGFIATDTCPFFKLAEAVVAETTCDGKKKMYELIASVKPMHVCDLPQMPEGAQAQAHWEAVLRKLKSFLEETLETTIADEAVERELRETNAKNRLMLRFFDYVAHTPPAVSWSEMYDVIAVAQVATLPELEAFLAPVFERLDGRVNAGRGFGDARSPRVLVTGCPVNGDSAKVFRVIEELGGVVVGLEGCSGMKPFRIQFEEGTPDPLAAVARAYLTVPCSCMTPNDLRIEGIDDLVARYAPDVAVDVVLQACHTFNIESHRVGAHVRERHGLPFLKVETDYSTGDVERIRLRLEALFGQVRK